ncbi:hypothetical protein CA13_10740 [Planctomycetes bacterium CA13]|uniref:Sulfatase-modifying factor enzyme-like domain-containing protein n=1 Tax=Novipirellula herctigrandis TaxID=2527986 RepID=A0A5C5YX84_9BACT|nr:hypothetical protein CA13_10740 [Planctomycetes bacterium CA13]
MDAHRILPICILVAVGCSPAENDSEKAAINSVQAPIASWSLGMPARITNQFGMTFCLVEIDSTRVDHEDSFPKASYYLQETELTWEQHEAFRKAAFGDGTYETIDWYHNNGHPSEWRDVLRYAKALSQFDTEYDYRLPSQQEWAFACKNGYEQTCPGEGAKSTIGSTASDRPNKYGIDGFMNYDAECADVPGLFLGKLDNWAGAYDDREKPACRCDQFTTGNPDADDGFNELIVSRFILVPQIVPSTNGG